MRTENRSPSPVSAQLLPSCAPRRCPRERSGVRVSNHPPRIAQNKPTAPQKPTPRHISSAPAQDEARIHPSPRLIGYLAISRLFSLGCDKTLSALSCRTKPPAIMTVAPPSRRRMVQADGEHHPILLSNFLAQTEALM